MNTPNIKFILERHNHEIVVWLTMPGTMPFRGSDILNAGWKRLREEGFEPADLDRFDWEYL